MEEITVSTKRTPELIAAEINKLREETKRVVIYNSIEIGRRLTEAKELVAPGEWGHWLEENVDYKKSTANNLMRIFKEYGADQLSLLGSNTAKEIYDRLDYTKAVALLGTTEEEKEEIINNNDIENMSSRELKKIKDELKKAEAEKEKAYKEIEKLEREKETSKNIQKGIIENLRKDKENLESEMDKIRSDRDELVKGLRDKAAKKSEEAKKALETAKEVQDEMNKLNGEIEKLKKEKEELENKPVEVTGKLEKNEEMEKQLEENKKRLEELEEKNKELEKKLEEKPVEEADDSVARYAIYFTDVNDKLDKMIGALKGMKEEDKGDYLEATKQFFVMIQESLKKI